MIGANWVDTLAWASVMGMDVGWLLELDPLARNLAMEILHKSVEIQNIRDRKLANMIVEELAEAMNRK
jgi:hypothetical protein